MSTTATTVDPEQRMLGEVEMVGRDRWEEIHRRARAGGSILAIARELELALAKAGVTFVALKENIRVEGRRDIQTTARRLVDASVSAAR